MQELYNLIKGYTINDAILLEKNDLQYISLKKLYEKSKNNINFEALIIANCIVCYQLSSTGEKYWDEFSLYFSDKINTSRLLTGEEIILLLSDFLPNSKGNKRFVDTKINRLKKLKAFLEKYIEKNDYYNNNLIILRDELASTMKQEKTAKTIVFAVKMLLYALSIKNGGNSIICPFEIEIPIDSRLTQIFEKYKDDYTDIRLFYNDLSKKINIPPIHLDAILWINSDKLI